MPTLDLLSQVLFVGLMAMFLFVLYKRFVRMLSQDRIAGTYAKVVRCDWENEGLTLAMDSDGPTECEVSWPGGSMQISSEGGHWNGRVEVGGSCPEEVVFTFSNQVVRRKM